MIPLAVRTQRRLQVLDLDLENRPLSYLGPDWTSAEITAVAWAWLRDTPVTPRQVHSLVLTERGVYLYHTPERRGGATALSRARALALLRDTVHAADIVTGHCVRTHDLPVINGALIEAGCEGLGAVLVSDTKEDLVRRKDLSVSQENLAALLRLQEPKHHMTQSEWREANRLTPRGIRAARQRVVADVVQHAAMRARLVQRRLLRPPRLWRP